MTERTVARHRARHKSGSPLSTLTGSLSVVGDYVGSARRSGVIIAMSSGLVASMALPAHAVTSAPVEAGGPQTASLPVIPAAEPAGPAFFAAPEAGLLALPADLVNNDVPVVAPAAATLSFDHTAFTAIRPGTLLDRIGAGQSGRSAGISLTANTDTTPAAGPVTVQPPVARPSSTPSAGSTTSTETAPAPQSSAPPASTSGSSVLSVAARYVGIQYRWGGTTTAGFDCSGFTQYVYGALGKHLPRTVAEQRNAVKIISRSQAKPGDLVIFGSSHIGIYAGGNMMYDSPHRGASIGLRPIYSGNVSFGRV